MTLDVHTLFLVTIYVEAILGFLLLFVWAQNMALRAVCWWGFAHMVRLVSIGLFSMYGAVPELISIDLESKRPQRATYSDKVGGTGSNWLERTVENACSRWCLRIFDFDPGSRRSRPIRRIQFL